MDLAFDLGLEHGRCVGVHIPPAEEGVTLLEATLAPEERSAVATLGPFRRRSWAAGRVAMREALSRIGVDASPAVLAGPRGAPVLPAGLSGSISHKDRLAVALVARGEGRVGVDVEMDEVRVTDIAGKVLTDEEAASLAGMDRVTRAREVLLRFSLKEAIYKALDPFVERYVGFKEVAVSPVAEGAVVVRASLLASDPAVLIEARWLRFDGLILTTARVHSR